MNIRLQPVIDFGKMPIANAFLTPERFKDEFFYRMILGYDPKTHAIGLVNTVPLEQMFHDHYAFYSSTSKGMQEHFRKTAEKLLPYAGKGTVIELGSNDGIMLEAWKDFGVKAVGIEPSANVADVSRSLGHTVISKFMDDRVLGEIMSHGPISLVYAANTFCQFEHLSDYVCWITAMIGARGVLVFEDPYALDMIEKTAYDQVYDEHVWYFTVSFINAMFEPLGYHVFDCEHIPVHGGQLRMYVGHRDTHPARPVVSTWLEKEKNLDRQLELFKTNIEKSKAKLLEILRKIKNEGKRVCGFGAASKGVIVTNYCGIGPDLIPFVTDNTPIKIGTYYPGSHIPVVSQDRFTKDIEYAFLFAWNHLPEIDKYFSWFRQGGGHWITHVPTPRII